MDLWTSKTTGRLAVDDASTKMRNCWLASLGASSEGLEFVLTEAIGVLKVLNTA